MKQSVVFTYYWHTKREAPFLRGRKRRDFETVLRRRCRRLSWRVYALDINANKVGLVLAIPADISPHAAIAHLKHLTAGYLRFNYPELRKLPSIWTREYSVE